MSVVTNMVAIFLIAAQLLVVAAMPVIRPPPGVIAHPPHLRGFSPPFAASALLAAPDSNVTKSVRGGARPSLASHIAPIDTMGTQTLVCSVVVASVALLLLTTWQISQFGKSTSPTVMVAAGSTERTRVDTLDNAKVWAVLLVMYGHFLYFNMWDPKYDDHKTWLKGFEPLGSSIKTFIDIVSMPTLTFISGVVSKGPVSQSRLSRFVTFLVVPTLLWCFVVKPVFLGYVMNPNLQQLETSLKNVVTLNSFWCEWYLQALCFWRASTFAVWAHVRPAVGLVGMLTLSCVAGYTDFRSVHFMKLDETFGFLPYFAVGYVFPFKAFTEAFQPTGKMATGAVIFSLVWVYALMPALLWDPMVDGHGSYSCCGAGATFSQLSGLDHSLYWTRRLSKVFLDLVPSLLLTLVATPVFMKGSVLTWAGAYTLYPYIFHEGTDYWLNCLIQHFPPPEVTSASGHVLVLLLHVVWVVVVLMLTSSSYFRYPFAWCLHPTWFEALLRSPGPEAGEKPAASDHGDVGALPDGTRATGNECSQSKEAPISQCVSRQVTPNPVWRWPGSGSEKSESSGEEPSGRSSGEEPSDPEITRRDYHRPCRDKQLLPQSAAKPYYKYLLGIFTVTLILTTASSSFLFFTMYKYIIRSALLNDVLVNRVVLGFMWLAVLVQLAITIVQHILRCQELRLGMAPAALPKSKTNALKHVVVVCAYKEPLEVLRRTLGSLVAQEGLRTKPMVVLAMEARDESRHESFGYLFEEFGAKGMTLIMTEHVLTAGEVAGKSSNENFAVRQVYKNLVDKQGINPFEVMITVCDADSIFAPAYLNQVERRFWDMHDGRRLIYNGPINTYRNMGDTNALIQFFEMQRSHTETFVDIDAPITPQSNYSLTLGFASELNFWTADNISEDQQTGLKARVNNFCSATTVFVPSFICNDLVEGLADRYVQAKRHMWGGVEVTGWLVAMFHQMELRSWLLIATAEFSQSCLFKVWVMLAGWIVGLFALVVIVTNPPQVWLPAVLVMIFMASCTNILFAVSEVYLWKTCLKQFPIIPPTTLQVICWIVMRPVFLFLTTFCFYIVPMIDCLIHAWSNQDLVYVNAPKGTEKQRTDLEAIAPQGQGSSTLTHQDKGEKAQVKERTHCGNGA